MKPLLNVENLTTEFYGSHYVVRAVDNVSFGLHEAEIVGLVGESGCGKTVASRSIMGLIEYPGKIVQGSVYLNGADLLRMNAKSRNAILGSEIAMIFQDPTTALNPTKKIGWQIEFILKNNFKKRKKNAPSGNSKQFSVMGESLLKKVGIRSAKEVMHYYPHQLSGGMTQRVLIAIALGCRPKIVIADEPTTNLDVTIEAQILKLFFQLKEEINNATLFITHNLGVVAELCDRVIVMYAASIMEMMDATSIAESARHPYTLGLISSYPSIKESKKRLKYIPGEVPDLTQVPAGCAFSPRCHATMNICRRKKPQMRKIGPNHFAACHALEEK